MKGPVSEVVVPRFHGRRRKGRSSRNAAIVGPLWWLRAVLIVLLILWHPHTPPTIHYSAAAAAAVSATDQVPTETDIRLEREEEELPEEDGPHNDNNDADGGEEVVVVPVVVQSDSHAQQSHGDEEEATAIPPLEPDDDAVVEEEDHTTISNAPPGEEESMARPDDTTNQEESNQNGQQAPLDSHIRHDDDEAPEIIAAPTIPLERAPTAPVDPHQDIATMAVDDAETKEEEHANHVTVTESMQEQLSPVLDDEEWMDSNGPNNTSTTVNGGVVDTERLLELGYDDEYDDRTLLDVFAAAAKEWLTHKAVRTTFEPTIAVGINSMGPRKSLTQWVFLVCCWSN